MTPSVDDIIGATSHIGASLTETSQILRLAGLPQTPTGLRVLVELSADLESRGLAYSRARWTFVEPDGEVNYRTSSGFKTAAQTHILYSPQRHRALETIEAGGAIDDDMLAVIETDLVPVKLVRPYAYGAELTENGQVVLDLWRAGYSGSEGPSPAPQSR